MPFRTPNNHFLAASVLIILLTACSSSPKTEKPTIANNDDDTGSSGKVTVDKSKPATFNEYKAWRQANDPDGQGFANYKEWETAYKRWQLEQEAKQQ